MGKPGTPTDDLDAELDAALAATTCWYCANVPREYQDKIDVRVDAGSLKWAVFAELLRKHGFAGAEGKQIRQHYISSHYRDSREAPRG